MINGYDKTHTDSGPGKNYQYQVIITPDYARVIPLEPPEYGSLEARDLLRVALLDPRQMMPAGDYLMRATTLPFTTQEVDADNKEILKPNPSLTKRKVLTEIRVPIRDANGIEKILQRTDWVKVE